MILETDGYRINFTDAINAFKFDETDSLKSTYHGVTELKAVDIIAEFESSYLFVEIKNYNNPDDYYEAKGIDVDDLQKKHNKFICLKNRLKYKYRDSYIYRHAENKVDKPIYYLCLLNFDNALNGKLAKSLRYELPVGIKSPRWHKEIAKSCQVLNESAWNRNFPKWPLQKISN